MEVLIMSIMLVLAFFNGGHACNLTLSKSSADWMHDQFGSLNVGIVVPYGSNQKRSLMKFVKEQKSFVSFVSKDKTIPDNDFGEALKDIPLLSCVNHPNQLDSLVAFVMKNNLGTKKPFLVILNTPDNVEMTQLAKNIRIDQEIYFLQLQSKQVKEAYLVNDMVIVKTIGTVDVNKHSKLEFRQDKGISGSMVVRRGDFQGKKLRASHKKRPTISK